MTAQSKRHDGEGWRAHHAAKRRKFGMESRSKPWTGRRPQPRLKGLNGPCMKSQRVRDLLDLAAGAYQHGRMEAGLSPSLAERPEWLLDTTQSAERQPWGTCLPCCGTSSRIYSFKLDQVLCPSQLAFVHGRPLILA